jgi:predicted GH43/DUF377 family glycosyl hydrolase
VNAVLNSGATLVDGATVLLCRVEDRRGISELTVARSADGVSDWLIDPDPVLSPSAGYPEEAWGVEDPRITRVDELDCWVIAFTAFGPQGPAGGVGHHLRLQVGAALSADFRVTRLN